MVHAREGGALPYPIQLLVIRCHLNHGLAEGVLRSTVQHLPHGAPYRVLVPAPKSKAQPVVIGGNERGKEPPEDKDVSPPALKTPRSHSDGTE